MKQLARNLALGSFSFAVVIAVVELALRAMPGLIPLDLLVEFQPDLRSAIAARRELQRAADTVLLPRDDGGPPEKMWVYKGLLEVTYDFDEPGIVTTVRMDEQGFCNSDPKDYGSEHFDVIAIGDSFTWCTTVRPEDAWPEALERLSGLSAYNLGLPGRGLHEHLQILKQFGLAKTPDVVVLNVYEGNDFRDALLFHEANVAAPLETGGPPCPFPTAAACRSYAALKNGLPGRYSFVYNLLASGLWRLAYVRERSRIDFQYDVVFPDGKRLEFNSRNGDRDELESARRLHDGNASLAVFDDALGGLAKLADREGFELVVAYTPSAYSAYGDRARFRDPEIAEVMRSYSDAQRRYFAAKAEQLGYRFVDMTPALAAAADTYGSDRPLYFRTNSHLTTYGHQVVAEELTPVVRRLAGR